MASSESTGNFAVQAEAAAVLADVESGGVFGEKMPRGIEAGNGNEDCGILARIAPWTR